MAESDALRAKRSRQHRAGDHSICRPDRCDKVPAHIAAAWRADNGPKNAVPAAKKAAPATKTAPKPASKPVRAPKTAPNPVAASEQPPEADPEPQVPEIERLPGGIEQAVLAFVATLPYAALDPRALLAQICIRLAQRVDETGAMPAAVRELRVMLMQLTEVPNSPAGPVDEARLKRAQRKLDLFLANATALS